MSKFQDDELENAIGDVFKQFALENDKQTYQEQQQQQQEQEQQQEEYQSEELDINFDDAIHDAFKSLDGIRQPEQEEQTQEEQENPQTQDKQEQAQEHEQKEQQEQHRNEEKELNEQETEHKENEPENEQQQENEQHENSQENSQRQLAEQAHSELHEHDENDDDFNLASAITNAIQSINTIRPGSHSPAQDKDQDQDHSKEQEQPHHHQETDHHHQETYQDHHESDQDHQEHHHQESHQDHQGQDHEEEAHSAHSPYSPLQMEKPDEDDLDLQNAIGNAFESIKKSSHSEISDDMLQQIAKEISHQVTEGTDKSVPKIDENVLDHFASEANKKPEEDEDDQLQSTIANAVKNVIENDKEAELNNLEMNDILTNAFNMAMENPTELLSNLQEEKGDELKLDNDLHKRLSIFDSLKKPVDLNNQLSMMMSNLSKNNDSSLLSVIKSLTTFLTNSNFQIFKSSQSLISIINQYKQTSLEKLFLNSLNLSKDYLRSNSKEKATVAIDNVLILFGKSSTGDGLSYNFNLITLINNSIINCIGNFTNLKGFKNTIFKRPKLSDAEYKERIRLENRERKKRWREENSERNKDNDLRSRVLKRANITFGDEESIEKTNWIEEEFNRRREKRIMKQKKDSSPSSSSAKDLSNDQFIQDHTLIQIITDFFNIFSNFAPKDDPDTGLHTTTVSISCSAIIYLLEFNAGFEFKRIDTIVTSIINNLLGSFNSIDQQERLLYLAKGANPKLESLRSLYSNDLGYETENSLDHFETRTDAQTLDESTRKRFKLVSKDSVANLKFPSYKKDGLKKPTPASQNKLQVNLNNLKKPGTYKKPSFNEKKEKNLGFPQFYSTSIKH